MVPGLSAQNMRNINLKACAVCCMHCIQLTVFINLTSFPVRKKTRKKNEEDQALSRETPYNVVDANVGKVRTAEIPEVSDVLAQCHRITRRSLSGTQKRETARTRISLESPSWAVVSVHKGCEKVRTYQGLRG